MTWKARFERRTLGFHTILCLKEEVWGAMACPPLRMPCSVTPSKGPHVDSETAGSSSVHTFHKDLPCSHHLGPLRWQCAPKGRRAWGEALAAASRLCGPEFHSVCSPSAVHKQEVSLPLGSKDSLPCGEGTARQGPEQAI